MGLWAWAPTCPCVAKQIPRRCKRHVHSHIPQAVVDQHLEPVGTPVGEHLGVVGLRACRETPHHLCQQHINAPAQVAHTSGQCNSTRAGPLPSSSRTLALPVIAGPTPATGAATNSLGRTGTATPTPSSRARQRPACSLLLAWGSTAPDGETLGSRYGNTSIGG